MSAIEWTGKTWNPTTGCDRISPGCQKCYAATLAARLKLMGQPKYQVDGDPVTSGPGFGLTLHPMALDVPERRKKPTTWFVNSMSDLFHQDVPDEFISAVFATMVRCPQHTFQILTKRPKRMRAWFDTYDEADRITRRGRVQNQLDFRSTTPRTVIDAWPLPNVWLGTSIESDTYAFRANFLRRTPAAVRFLSLEPLLGPLPSLSFDGIDWVIVGAESGRGARPMDDDWVRDIRDRATVAGARVFFKQRADNGRKISLPELDGRVWDEMPEVVR